MNLLSISSSSQLRSHVESRSTEAAAGYSAEQTDREQGQDAERAEHTGVQWRARELQHHPEIEISRIGRPT
jgi:hypothetical protein